MAPFILGIIVLLLGIGLGVFCFTYKKAPKKGASGNMIIDVSRPLRKFSVVSVVLGIIFAGLLGWLSCMTSVPTGHTGVLTTFGKVENTTFDAEELEEIDNIVLWK